MEEMRELMPLPKALRTLRPGLHGGVHVHRVLHLAAAKIEDLEEKVASLSAALAQSTAKPRPRRRRRVQTR